MGFSHDLVPQTILVGHTQTILEPKNSLFIHSESGCFSNCGSKLHFIDPLILVLSLLDLLTERWNHFQGIDLPFIHYMQVETLHFFPQFWHYMPSFDAVTMTFSAQSIRNDVCFTRVVLNIQVIIL